MKKQLEILSRQVGAYSSLHAGEKLRAEDPDRMYWDAMSLLPHVSQLDMLRAECQLMEEGTSYETFKAACDAIAEEKLQELLSGPAADLMGRDDYRALYDFTRSWAADNPDSAMVQQWQNAHGRHDELAKRGWEYDEPRP